MSKTWGERLADVLLSRWRVPAVHEMDERQLAIFRAGVAAGRAQAARKAPTPAEARMALLQALEAEAMQLRAFNAGLRADLAERADWRPAKGVL